MRGSRTAALMENTASQLRRPNLFVLYHTVTHGKRLHLFTGWGPHHGAAEQMVAFASSFSRALAEHPVTCLVKLENGVRLPAKATIPPLPEHVH
jgi:hypothetical protein